MIAPTVMLWLYAAAYGIAAAFGPGDGDLQKHADMAASVGFPFLVAWWVMADARKRGRQLFYDYDSFVYFAWLVVVPLYLFQTRGVRAFLTLLCFAGIWLISLLSAEVTIFIRRIVS